MPTTGSLFEMMLSWCSTVFLFYSTGQLREWPIAIPIWSKNLPFSTTPYPLYPPIFPLVKHLFLLLFCCNPPDAWCDPLTSGRKLGCINVRVQLSWGLTSPTFTHYRCFSSPWKCPRQSCLLGDILTKTPPPAATPTAILFLMIVSGLNLKSRRMRQKTPNHILHWPATVAYSSLFSFSWLVLLAFGT